MISTNLLIKILKNKVEVKVDNFKNEGYDQRKINESVNKSISQLLNGIDDIHQRVK